MTIKKTLQEFKRTHQDNWQVEKNFNSFEIRDMKHFLLQEHKTKFTEDQLYTMTDILVSHNYYA